MSDIEKAFTFLQDNVPQWLQDVVGMEDKVTAMQDQNTRVPISHSPFGKWRSNSNASIRPPKLDAIAEHIVPLNETNTNVDSSRKRKSMSVSSGRVSGDSRYRARTMVIVSYDGDVQKSFELLVRAIGTARNLLRKAKMEAKLNEMAAQAESSEEEEDVDEEEETVILSRDKYRSRMSSLRARAAARRSGRLGVNGGDIIPAELFNTTDKTLEQAQELCEKAAHLTLRDGDCRRELESVRTNFESLLQSAKTEVGKCSARKTQDPPELQAHETSDTSVSSIEPESSYRKHTAQASLPVSKPDTQAKSTLQQGSPALPSAPPKIVDIEVDDNDDDDDDFVMPPVRLTSRFNRRD